MSPSSSNRPSIVIALSEGYDRRRLGDLLLGIEEEGVPARVVELEQINPLVLAHRAAQEAILDVGIGIALDYVVVTTEKLPQERPYMAYWFATSAQADRTIGGNAARLVKRMPLRVVPQEALGK